MGSAAASWTVEGSLVASLVIATASSVQALAGAALIRRHIGLANLFRRAKDVLKFAGLAVLVSTITPICALLPLGMLHSIAGQELFRSGWWTGWQGEAIGIVVLAPLLLSWAGAGSVRWTRHKAAEGLLFAVLLVLATQAVFRAGGDVRGTYATSFLILPLIAWGAFRFSAREVTTAIAVVCGVALWHTPQTNQALLLFLLFIVTVVFTGLLLRALLNQLEDAMPALQGRQRQLELRVAERTQDLEHANRRFRLMVESVVDYAIFMLDAAGRVASWNAGAQRIFRLSGRPDHGAAFLVLLPARRR